MGGQKIKTCENGENMDRGIEQKWSKISIRKMYSQKLNKYLYRKGLKILKHWPHTVFCKFSASIINMYFTGILCFICSVVARYSIFYSYCIPAMQYVLYRFAWSFIYSIHSSLSPW